MIVARLVLDYDMGMPGGMEGRHKQIVFGKTVMPDAGKTLVFKRVEV